MGEVYRARDTRLDRTVAVKVLPGDLATDPQLKARFEREARAISALAHPHICTLHDIGEEDGQTFLVMEHLVGQTLADRLKKGPLPLDQALEVATQIADALAAAHKQRIIHRDLKPGNVMLTKTGARLLDFGLARLTAHGEQPAVRAETSAPTEHAPLTGQGTILGTLPYMAPEQVEGQPADERTDLWALGAILYEMLAGSRAFGASTPTSLVAAILERQPALLAERQPLTPASLERLVRRCLAKDPDDRWQSAIDLRDELRWITEGPGDASMVPAGSSASRGVPVAVAAAAAIAIAAVAALAAWLLKPAPLAEGGAPTRFVMTLPPGEVLAPPYWDSPMALSPDGARLAYSGGAWTAGGGAFGARVRAMDSLQARSLPDTAVSLDAGVVAFSPDGEWLAFIQDRAIRKIPVRGGDAETVCEECAPNARGLTWGPNDTIVFTPSVDNGGVWAVSADGGTPQPLTELDPDRGERNHRWAQLLPPGEVLLFTAASEGNWGEATIEVQRLGTGERKTLIRGGTYGRYLPSGHLVYVRQGMLMAASFDTSRLELGPEVRVAEGISQHPGNGVPRLAFSDAGSLVYVSDDVGRALDAMSLVWVDRTGAVESLGVPPRPYTFARLSPEGERIAVGINGARAAVWVYDVGGGSLNSLTFEADGASNIPVWAGGGDRIAFHAYQEGSRGLLWKKADFSGAAQKLSEREALYASSASPDGQWLACTEYIAGSPRDGDLVMLSPGADPTLRPFVQTPFWEGGGCSRRTGDGWRTRPTNPAHSKSTCAPFRGPAPSV
jgi:serine/threonine-protein kinase